MSSIGSIDEAATMLPHDRVRKLSYDLLRDVVLRKTSCCSLSAAVILFLNFLLLLAIS